MYKCEIMTVNSEALGKLYAVLGKRNAKILDESMKDATSMFLITAHVPVADSFGLAEEIRKRTSGLASPHLEFSHFEVIEIDPYWEPKTEEVYILSTFLQLNLILINYFFLRNWNYLVIKLILKIQHVNI